VGRCAVCARRMTTFPHASPLTSQELVIRTERAPDWYWTDDVLGGTLSIDPLAFSRLGPIAASPLWLTLDLQTRTCVGVFQVGLAPAVLRLATSGGASTIGPLLPRRRCYRWRTRSSAWTCTRTSWQPTRCRMSRNSRAWLRSPCAGTAATTT
jgi:hypothetical protein